MPASAAFLEVNNLPLSVADESFKTSSEDVMTFERSAGMTYEGLTRRELRSISFSTIVDTQQNAMALRDWVKGRGYRWTFTREGNGGSTFSRISTEGALTLGGLGNGPEMATTALAKFGRHGMLLDSGVGNTAVATIPIGTNDVPAISVGFFRRLDSSNLEYCAMRYSVGTVECFVGSLITTAFTFATLVATALFSRFSVSGATTSGSACTAVYDNIYLAPFYFTEEMLVALSTASMEYARLPYVSVYGLAMEDEVPVAYKMHVESNSAKQVWIDGGWRSNAQILSVTGMERGRLR